MLNDLARRLGLDLGVLTGRDGHRAAVRRRCRSTPALTLEEIGGKGVRWPERDAASAWPPAPSAATSALEDADRRARRGRTAACAWARSARCGAGPRSCACRRRCASCTRPTVELSPADAQRLKLFQGDRVVVGSDGATVDATVTLRDAMPEGTVFMETTALDGPLVEVRKA